jgi:hypothetical protein
MKLGAFLNGGLLIKGSFLKGRPRKFAVRYFEKLESFYKNLMKSPNNLQCHFSQFTTKTLVSLNQKLKF